MSWGTSLMPPSSLVSPQITSRPRPCRWRAIRVTRLGVSTRWSGAVVARTLIDHGVDVEVLEAAAVVGGHARCEVLNGFVYEPNGAHIFHTSNATASSRRSTSARTTTSRSCSRGRRRWTSDGQDPREPPARQAARAGSGAVGRDRLRGWRGRARSRVDHRPMAAVDPTATPVAYDGVCNLCGWEGRFESDGVVFRVGQQFKCGGCRAALRYRDEAVVLLQEFGRGLHLTLDALVADPWFRAHSVYYVGERGPAHDRLATMPDYVESRYVPDAPLGDVVSERATMQDLERLTYADASFDLVVSSHVMEHVPNPWRALAEVRRVLRPAGRYVFSIPFRYPALAETIVRAVVEGDN